MAERQVIKEKYGKRGLFDFLHFPALLLLGDRLELLLDYPDVSYSPPLRIQSFPPPPHLAEVGIDPLLQELSPFVAM